MVASLIGPLPLGFLFRRCPDCGKADLATLGRNDPPNAVVVVLSCLGCEPEQHTIIRFTDLDGLECR